MWIEARSNVHPIHSEATGLEGWLEMTAADGKVDLDQPYSGHLEFPVENLKSGNPLEDRELRRRIDSRKYPTIAGDLTSVTVSNGSARHRVNGSLSFRGVTRTYEDDMTIEPISDNTMKLTGESTFDIRDFGMEPPRILMLKVQPDVKVRVEIIAERS